MSAQPFRAPSIQSEKLRDLVIGEVPSVMQRSKPPKAAILPYCGKIHSIIDGLPIAHRCRIVPAEAIAAAIRGDFERAITIFAGTAAKGPLPRHAGVWRTKRR
jgi:hypothetical protein